MIVPKSLKRTIILSFAGIFISGVGYWFSHLYLRKIGAFGDEPGRLEKILGPTHLGMAVVFIFVMGIVWSQHVRFALRMKQNRASGWIFYALVAGLATTGIVMLYGSEALIKGAEAIHPWLGLLLLPTVVYHWTKAILHRRRPNAIFRV